MGKDTLRYIALCMAVYLFLFLLELFPLNPLCDFIGFGFWTHFIIYIVLLLIINPLLTRFISSRFDFREKIKEGEDL